MHGLQFLQDLAVVMLVAGLVTLLFRWLRQPVVLGYLLAGFIIGPNTPPFPMIQDEGTIQILADVGVVFLMFSLGLDFSFKKLKAVGVPAFITAAFEIMVMIGVGYLLGAFFGWTPMESVFLGIMLALTSTTIVVKSLRDAHALKEKHGVLISGVSIFDDIFVIFVMILLPGFAVSGQIPAGEVALTLLRLFVFLVAAVVVGLIVVPRFLRFIGRMGSDEMLLIVVLGLCFGLALLTVKIGYSAALGAFLIGAMMAESRELGRIVRLTAPIRDMFSAVFFVAIGMLINPSYIAEYGAPVLVITAVYVVAKVGACATGALMAGYDGHTAMRVGTGMAQVGEFAFILATLGVSLGAIGPHLYPVIVAVASLNAFIRPYLTGNADRATDVLARRLPAPVIAWAHLYSGWLGRLEFGRKRSAAVRVVRSLTWQLLLNLALVSAIFIAAAVIVNWLQPQLAWLPEWTGGARTVGWLGSALLALPVYVATVRKMQAMGMMLSEIAVTGGAGRANRAVLRSFLANTIFVVQLAVLLLLSFVLSLALLPPLYVSAALLVVIVLLVVFRGPALNAWYTRAKFAVVETWNQPPHEPEEEHPMPALLREARMESLSLTAGMSAVGKLIRELQLRSETGASIVAIERAGRTLVNPDPDEELRPDDKLLLLGSSEQLTNARLHLQG
ncbi:MAG TPA: cation:proton antiporter [Kiritimatiellia bacterium]|nr:cation:proton antiporter [Kiritimatiellia bacterium]